MTVGIHNAEAALVEGNLRVAMGGYSLVGGDGDTQEGGELVMTSCGFDSAVFNAAMPVRGDINHADLLKMIATARQHYGARKLGWTFWLCESLLTPETVRMHLAVFRDHGMYAIARPPGMISSGLSQPSPALPSLWFRRVQDEATRLEFAYLSSLIFSLPFATARRIYGSEQFWKGAITGWIGQWDGKTVSIVTVVVGLGVAGVYSLGTLQAFQGKGFGEAILRHALQVAHDETGSEVTVLQTTHQGLKLYQKLGFRVVTNFSVFLQEGCKAV